MRFLTSALRARLIDDARLWWRMWSIRFGAFASIAAAWLVAAPDTMISVINALPPELRTFLPPATGATLFAVVTLLRLWKQGGKRDA